MTGHVFHSFIVIANVVKRTRNKQINFVTYVAKYCYLNYSKMFYNNMARITHNDNKIQ